MNQTSLFDESEDVDRFDPMPLALAVGRGPVVLVDELQQWGAATKGQAAKHFGAGKSSCHMMSTGSIDPMHAMAQIIGLRREWFQDNGASWPHYDLTPRRRAAALKSGAVFCPARTQALIRIEVRAEIRGRRSAGRPVSLQAWETIVADCWTRWALRIRGLP